MFSSLLFVFHLKLTTRQKTYSIYSFCLSMYVAMFRSNIWEKSDDLQTNQLLVLLIVECSPGHDRHPHDGLHCGDGQRWESHRLHPAVFNLLPGYRGTLWHWGCCHVLDKQGMSAGKASWGVLCCLCDLIRDERLGCVFVYVGISGLFCYSLFPYLLFMEYKQKNLQN